MDKVYNLQVTYDELIELRILLKREILDLEEHIVFLPLAPEYETHKLNLLNSLYDKVTS